ncbi:MAG: nitrilase-related carbon-nitrogen hydrolase [Fimbriimonadaceae bacterium]
MRNRPAPFQVACLQTKPTKGDLAKTLNHLAENITQAATEGADLVVLPESAPTGYVLEGGVDELALTPSQLTHELESRLQNLPKQLDIAISYYEKTPRRPFNSAAYITIKDGKTELLHNYHKFFLPTYGVFDEHRFHEEGSELGIVDTRFGKIGILICEDVWHSILPTLLTVAGAELIVIHSASPAREFQADKPGNLIRYDQMLQGLCNEHGVFCAMAMLAGFEGGKGLVGGSQIVNPLGERLVQAKNFGEQIVMAEVDLDLVDQARAATPLASDLKERWLALTKIVNQLAK